MPNNRHLINDQDVVRPAQLLDKGIPLPFLSGRYVVDEGWVGVITEGGVFKEALKPGTYFLNRYRFFRDVKAIAVDTRQQTLTVSTVREFTIAQPVPVEINLNLAVEYRICDARRVALEVRTPLTSLYDRVLQAVRGIVTQVSVDEIRTQGEGIAHLTFQRLKAMHLPRVLGIEVLNVLTTSIKATDAGNDALATRTMDEYTRTRDWQMDQAMLEGTQVDWNWLALHRPELAQQMLANQGMVAQQMIDKGLLDPAGVLQNPANSKGQGNIELDNILNPFKQSNQGQSSSLSVDQQPQLPQDSAQPEDKSVDIHDRIREEIQLLQKMPGCQVETQPGMDEHGVPDGSYNMRIVFPRTSGGEIVLYISCMPTYPKSPPIVTVDVDGQEQPFQSAILRRWQGQYLIELAREVKQWFA
jgi:hypothetical protein